MFRFFLGLFLFWGGTFFFPSINPAKVNFKIYDPQNIEESLRSACTLMKKNSLISKRHSMAFFDCMGEKVNVRSFCLKMIKIKKMPNVSNRPFLRGVVYKEGKALCQFGSSAVLTFNLKDFKNDVEDSIELCKKLRKSYAFDLKEFHFYRGKSDKRSCYYSQEKNL